MALCVRCHQRLDPIWPATGYDTHPTCDDDFACIHGTPRGPKYCAICRRANPAITPPEPPPKPGRRKPVEAPAAPVGKDHPRTSKDAAARALPATGTKRRMVYEAITASPDGLCDWQLEAMYGWKHESASACRRSLVTDGWLADSGRTRPVPDTGNPAIVWIARPEGEPA